MAELGRKESSAECHGASRRLANHIFTLLQGFRFRASSRSIDHTGTVALHHKSRRAEIYQNNGCSRGLRNGQGDNETVDLHRTGFLTVWIMWARYSPTSSDSLTSRMDRYRIIHTSDQFPTRLACMQVLKSYVWFIKLRCLIQYPYPASRTTILDRAHRQYRHERHYCLVSSLSQNSYPVLESHRHCPNPRLQHHP